MDIPFIELVSENLEAKQTAPPVPIDEKSFMTSTVKSLDTAMYTQSGILGSSSICLKYLFFLSLVLVGLMCHIGPLNPIL